MVHPLGLLEEGDIASSPEYPPLDDVEEDEDAGKYSDADYRSEDKDCQDGEDEDDGEEVAPTCKDWEDDLPNIPSTEPARSKANPSGSGDPASKKRSPTLVRSASVESIPDPKRRKVMEDVMGALLGKIGPNDSSGSCCLEAGQAGVPCNDSDVDHQGVQCLHGQIFAAGSETEGV